MANSINVNQNNNNVSLQDANGKVIITDDKLGVNIEVTQPVTNIVTVSSLGPQGQAGVVQDTGSLLLTSSFNAFTASYYIDSASFDTNILNNSSSIALLSGSFETFSGSYNTGSFTGSFYGDGSNLTGIVSSKWTGSNPITREGNVEITGSLIISGSSTFINIGPAIFSGSVTGINGFTGSLLGTAESSSYAESASYASTASYALNAGTSIDTGSFVTTSSFDNFTSSYNDTTSSFVTTSSFNDFTSSYNDTTGSFVTTSSFNDITSSFVTTSSFNDFTSSYNDTTSSFVTTSSFNSFTSSYNTGSFLGNLDGTSSYSNIASSVTTLNQDVLITGSLTVLQGATIYGSSSFTYITASQLAVSASFISVNVFEPAQRFGGLKVYDSGSSTASASLAWDSLHNHWVYENVDGATYTGGMLLSGPRNTGSLGDEPNLTKWFVPRGDGGDHLNDSQIFTSASITQITGSLIVTAGITGSIQGTSSLADSVNIISTNLNNVYNLVLTQNSTGPSLLRADSNASILYNPFTNTLFLGANTSSPVGQLIVTGSIISTQGITGSLLGTASFATSASYALTASYLDNYVPPFPFTGSALITGSLGVTGSVIVTAGITGSLLGTSSWANDAQTASYVETAQTASYVLNAVSASYVPLSPPFPYTGSAEITGSLTVTGSIYTDSTIYSPFAISLNFLSAQTYSYKTPYVIQVNSAESDPSGSIEIIYQASGSSEVTSSYSFGSTVNKFDKLIVTPSSASLVILNSIRI
jgi:hypothetical protein